jgi:hypothetical protein
MTECDFALLAISPCGRPPLPPGFAPTADERLCALLLGRNEELAVVASVNAEQLHDAVPDLELVRCTYSIFLQSRLDSERGSARAPVALARRPHDEPLHTRMR